MWPDTRSELGARHGSPGVTELASPRLSLLVVIGYLVGFTVFAATLMRQRDRT